VGKNHGTKGDSTLHADKLTAYLSRRDGRTASWRRARCKGHRQAAICKRIRAKWKCGGGEPGQAAHLARKRRVNGRDPKSGMTRSLASNAVQLTFAGGKAGCANRVQHAETLERGEMEWLMRSGALQTGGGQAGADSVRRGSRNF